MPVDQNSDADELPELTFAARIREVAAIFAAGIARLNERSTLVPATSPDKSRKTDERPLEEPV